MSQTQPKSGSESGITLIELLLGSAVALVFVTIAQRSMAQMHEIKRTNDLQTELQAQSHKAMGIILRDLRRSAFRDDGTKALPYVFDDGVALAPFTMHAHTPASSEAVAGDNDFGPNREIVFSLPMDANADGRPDLANHDVVWASDEFSYTVITDSVGNGLARSVNGAPTIVARNIERAVFDTPATCGYAIPLGTVRVRLFFRTRSRKGKLYTYQTEAVVRLRQENL